jgi:hypothetical protein
LLRNGRLDRRPGADFIKLHFGQKVFGHFLPIIYESTAP